VTKTSGEAHFAFTDALAGKELGTMSVSGFPVVLVSPAQEPDDDGDSGNDTGSNRESVTAAPHKESPSIMALVLFILVTKTSGEAHFAFTDALAGKELGTMSVGHQDEQHQRHDADEYTRG
jgi:hypothetical protein